MELTNIKRNIRNLAKDFQKFTDHYYSVTKTLNEKLQNLCNSYMDNNQPTLEVKGSNGAIYAVDLNNNTCTCPHYQYRLKDTNKICKHLKKVRWNVSGKLLKSMPEPQISSVSHAHTNSVKVEENNYEIGNKTCTHDNFQHNLNTSTEEDVITFPNNTIPVSPIESNLSSFPPN